MKWIVAALCVSYGIDLIMTHINNRNKRKITISKTSYTLITLMLILGWVQNYFMK